MKKILFTALISFVLYCTSAAQQLSPTTVSCGGSSRSAANILLEDNMGGTIVNTISSPTIMYTQGFIQPDAGTVNSLPPINDVVLNSGAGIDNGGSTFINGNIMLEFTVAETASKTLFSVNNMLTQGILQPLDAKYWTGLINSDWRNVNNWAPPSEPTPDDHAIIPALCPNYPVITNGVTANCKSLTAKPGSSVTVNTGGLLKIHN